MLSAWLCTWYWFSRSPSNLIQLWSWPCLEPKVGPGDSWREIPSNLNYSMTVRCRWRGICSHRTTESGLLTQLSMQGKGTSLTSVCLKIKGHGMAQQRIYNFRNPIFSTWNPSQCQNILFSQFCCVGSSSLCCVSWRSLLKVNRKCAHLRLPFKLNGMTRTPVQAHA